MDPAFRRHWFAHVSDLPFACTHVAAGTALAALRLPASGAWSSRAEPLQSGLRIAAVVGLQDSATGSSLALDVRCASIPAVRSGGGRVAVRLRGRTRSCRAGG